MTREIIESARGRETSQISMIKVRGSEREWVGVGRSGRDDKQKRLLKQKVVLDTHFFWNRTLYCASAG